MISQCHSDMESHVSRALLTIHRPLKPVKTLPTVDLISVPRPSTRQVRSPAWRRKGNLWQRKFDALVENTANMVFDIQNCDTNVSETHTTNPLSRKVEHGNAFALTNKSKTTPLRTVQQRQSVTLVLRMNTPWSDLIGKIPSMTTASKCRLPRTRESYSHRA